MKVSARTLGSAAVRVAPVGGTDAEVIDDKPRSVYELLTRQMLEQVKADIAEVKQRVNALLWLVVGAMLVEVVMRVVR